MFTAIQTQFKQALLTGDQVEVEVLRLLRSDILASTKDRGFDQPTDQICYDIIRRMIKQFQQAASFYQQANDQPGLKLKQAEVKILQNLLPEQLTDDQLLAVIKQVASANDLTVNSTNLGQLIGLVGDQVGPRASRSRIAQLINQVNR